MIKLGTALILLVFIIVLLLAVIAIIRGYKGMKMSKSFNTDDRKVKIAYWVISVIHMCMGILITLCYMIAGIVILNRL